jgi:cytochrome c oxidase cbb3-type subunit 3
LHPNEVVLMAAYVAGLRGKDLKGRPAEGEKIDPWPIAAAAKPPLPLGDGRGEGSKK